MADNNNENGMPPAWAQDAEHFAKHFKETNIESWKNTPSSITFDYEAQANLPDHIKAKMEADRFNAETGNKSRISKIEKILSNYRKQEDFSDYRLAAYIVKNCME